MKHIFTSIISISLVVFSLTSNAQIINTVVGSGTAGFSGDGGLATAAQINQPNAIAFDGTGNMYIADFLNYRVRKVTTAGIISTVVGNGTFGFSGDGGPATSAQLTGPTALCFDAFGNLYIADQANNRIRKVNTSGVISTFAGTGIAGFGGDGGSATLADLNSPTSIALDALGNMYIADQANNRIRKINTSGTISTFAGTGVAGFSGDGAAALSAQLNSPYCLSIDLSGNFYIVDVTNKRIRKINTSGVISTFAGNGTTGFSGDGGPATSAQFNSPNWVSNDAFGNIYITDAFNSRIRKVNTSGVISTFAGSGVAGYAGDGGICTSAQILLPIGTAFDAAGNFYICDDANYRVRKITLVTDVKQLTSSNTDHLIYPNPSLGIFNFELFSDAEITITNALGQEVLNEKLLTGKQNIDLKDQAKGIYFLKITGQEKEQRVKLIKE